MKLTSNDFLGFWPWSYEAVFPVSFFLTTGDPDLAFLASILVDADLPLFFFRFSGPIILDFKKVRLSVLFFILNYPGFPLFFDLNRDSTLIHFYSTQEVETFFFFVSSDFFSFFQICPYILVRIFCFFLDNPGFLAALTCLLATISCLLLPCPFILM